MKLFWLDLETTGLDPMKCSILEVAYGISTLEDPFTLTERGNFTIHHMRRKDDGVDPFVVEMHTKNGLWEECQAASLSMRDVEIGLLGIVPDVSDWEDKPTLAGNCVGFDHGFLKVYAPKLAARFHYRYYDVSSVKLFCRSLGMTKLPSGDTHRAADDVTESIGHAQRCAAWWQDQIEAMKLCTRCGSKYDGTGACSNKPCQGGRGEWCLEHHGAPFAYGVKA